MNRKDIDMSNENFVPVKPAQEYKVPYIADPIEFMVYGDRSLETFTSEVKKVEAELRREIYHSTNLEYPIDESNKRNDNSVKVKSHKKVNGNSLFSILFGFLILAMLVIGNWVKIDSVPSLFILVNGIEGFTGYKLVYDFVDCLVNSNPNFTIYVAIVASSIALIALISVVLILIGAFRIVGEGTGVFTKILNALRFVLAALIVVILLIDKILITEIAIGLWIIIGLTLISFVISLVAKRKIKNKKLED